jgi:chaperonin GroEL
VDIIRRAIEEPLRQIVQNGGNEPSVVLNKVRENSAVNFGYNAKDDRYEDLVLAGIIDPTKVTRSALQNAASVASLLLTTECMIAEAPKDDKSAAAPAMGGGYPGMM